MSRAPHSAVLLIYRIVENRIIIDEKATDPVSETDLIKVHGMIQKIHLVTEVRRKAADSSSSCVGMGFSGSASAVCFSGGTFRPSASPQYCQHLSRLLWVLIVV